MIRLLKKSTEDKDIRAAATRLTALQAVPVKKYADCSGDVLVPLQKAIRELGCGIGIAMSAGGMGADLAGCPKSGDESARQFALAFTKVKTRISATQ